MSLDRFVEECEAIIASRPPVALEGALIRQGSIWLSRSTGRRGSVVWATKAQVCLSYDETSISARKIHSVPDFLRLYSQVN